MALFGRSTERMLQWILEQIGLKTVALEVTSQCNQSCAFCYNVWKCGSYPPGQLDTKHTLNLIDRIIQVWRPQVISFTGGEPMLRNDICELISHASPNVSCNLITNGTLINEQSAKDLVNAGVKIFEFTLLSAERDVHNSLVGRESFDELIEAIASVKAAGGKTIATFVATSHNIHTWPETLELCVALGMNGILFNRFNVGGAGVAAAAELMPSIEEITWALETANKGVSKYGISISCGVPIPLCVIDTKPYRNLHFSNCAVGTKRAYPVIDPTGNVRPCNHSALILGNLFETDMRELLSNEASKAYARGVPKACTGCRYVKNCRGGCRAASEACGTCGGIDPFVTLCNAREG